VGQTPEEIRNDIEVTRAELRDDVDRIAQRASPRGMVRRRIDQLRGAFRTLKERVMGTSPGPGRSTGGWAAGPGVRCLS